MQVINEKIVRCNWNGLCKEKCKDKRIQKTLYYDKDGFYLDEYGINKDCVYVSHRRKVIENRLGGVL